MVARPNVRKGSKADIGGAVDGAKVAATIISRPCGTAATVSRNVDGDTGTTEVTAAVA